MVDGKTTRGFPLNMLALQALRLALEVAAFSVKGNVKIYSRPYYAVFVKKYGFHGIREYFIIRVTNVK